MKRENRRWKDMLLGAVVTLLISCMIVPTLAFSGTRNETLSYNNITVTLDGSTLALRDGTGATVEPFIIDGTTYLPIRAIAQALGLDVTWNSKTQTVALTTGSGTAGGNTGASTTGSYIGEARAKEIALNHAGISASSATFLRVQMDRDNGRMEYEVEFWSGSTEYDYDIDALTGEIRSYDRDIEGYNIPTQTQTGTDIGQTKAESIALSDAGVSKSDTVFLQTWRDWDDGRVIYEVEFYAGNREYDYEIDAYTGAIISKDYDAEYYTPSQSGSYIGEARAKEIALSQAGVSASNASFVKCKLDIDDGRAVYEIEFRSGWVEYEAEIDAYTGAIVDWDVD